MGRVRSVCSVCAVPVVGRLESWEDGGDAPHAEARGEHAANLLCQCGGVVARLVQRRRRRRWRRRRQRRRRRCTARNTVRHISSSRLRWHSSGRPWRRRRRRCGRRQRVREADGSVDDGAKAVSLAPWWWRTAKLPQRRLAPRTACPFAHWPREVVQRVLRRSGTWEPFRPAVRGARCKASHRALGWRGACGAGDENCSHYCEAAAAGGGGGRP